MEESRQPVEVEVSVSAPEELSSLAKWLGRIDELKVEREGQQPRPGEQGLWDFLSILAGSSSVLAVMIRTLPEFIRSRRSDVEVVVKRGEKSVTIRASNVQDPDSLARYLVDE